jgi:hypothetical protein
MRLTLALIALAIVWLAWPSTDCSNLTETECDRAELIAAGAID